MFKSLGNLGGMLKQAREISGRMDDMAVELKARKTTGSAGAGMVEIDVNGLSEVLACRIDPSVFANGDRELLEDLLVGAVNQAMAKAKEMHADALRSLCGGMDMPGLDEALAKLGNT